MRFLMCHCMKSLCGLMPGMWLAVFYRQVEALYRISNVAPEGIH